jgi:hypothetical protein
MQQINLYRLLPKPKPVLLSQKKVFIYYGIFTILLVLFYMYNVSQKHKLEAAVVVATTEVTEVQNNSLQLAQKYPISNIDELKKSMSDLEVQWQNKTSAIDLLTLNANFSAYLTGLANATAPGVWYTQILFARGVNNITLIGAALQATIVTELMKQLVKPAVFKIFDFSLSDVEEAKLPATFTVISKRAMQP